MNASQDDFDSVKKSLGSIGQEHVLSFWPALSDRERASLLADIGRVRLESLGGLIGTHVVSRPEVKLGARISPVEVMPARPEGVQVEHCRRARVQGEERIGAGKVAALTVAGGLGTRLGFSGPKGCFPISPLRNKTLFRLFAEGISATSQRYGAAIPWYVMTSRGNDGETREFFSRHKFFGLRREDVFFLVQGEMPAFSRDGRILLEQKHRPALSPDGHGGTLLALARSGALADMKRRGVETISYFQVDNPLVLAVDPLFVGLHDLSGSEMSSKAVSKADDLERVGNFVRMDGRVQVIEYSDLPMELAHRRNERGLRAFDAGNIAVHLLSVSFVERLTEDVEQFGLPWHRAEKKVPYVDLASGNRVEPDEPNAVKLETFVFDAIPLAGNPLVLETLRREEFSPVKNATGTDSVESAQTDMIQRAADWLGRVGVAVPRQPDGTPDAVVEISPMFALDAEAMRARVSEIPPIRNGDEVYLGPD